MIERSPLQSSGKPISRLCAAIFAAFALAYAPACSRDDSKPASSPSSSSAPGAPRVVALSPAIAVVMQDAGFDNLIVGRHAYDIVLPRTVPSCGEQGTIDYEALLAANPTHVFLQWGKQDLPTRLLDLGKSKGWIIENFDILSLDEIDRAQQRLARLLAPQSPLAPDRLTSTRIEQVRASHADLANRGTVLLIASAGSTFGILGPASCHAQVLARLGIQPAVTSGGAWFNMDAEDIRALNPSAIVLIQPRMWGSKPVAPTPQFVQQQVSEHLGALAGLNVPAVTSGRVGVIDDPLALIPSTSMAAFAHQLAQIVSDLPASEHK